MRDIVATIQAEQDEIIRLDHPEVLVIEGGPGTGNDRKPSVTDLPAIRTGQAHQPTRSHGFHPPPMEQAPAASRPPSGWATPRPSAP